MSELQKFSQALSQAMMEEVRREVVKSILAFLIPEVNNANLDRDQRDAIEVAIQCLESAYSLEGYRNDPNIINLVDVIKNIIETRKVKVVTDEDKAKAEVLKTEGNDAMRAQNFSEAIEKYTKAIELNPNNAIYYCNRAAALSRMNKHNEAIKDCQAAVKLDPTYSKAYGRLGIAYCNLQNYEEAKKAYTRAVELDPTNASYQANLRLAEQQISSGSSSQQQRRRPGAHDFSQLINNPNVVSIASQMMNDPAFRNVVTGIWSAEGQDPNPNINVLFQAGQQIAAQVEAANPELVETWRRTLNPQDIDEEEDGEGAVGESQSPRKPDDVE